MKCDVPVVWIALIVDFPDFMNLILITSEVKPEDKPPKLKLCMKSSAWVWSDDARRNKILMYHQTWKIWLVSDGASLSTRYGFYSIEDMNIEKCSFHEAPGANAMRTAGHEAPSCFLVRLHIWLALTYILFACQENVTLVLGRRVSLLSKEKNRENTTRGHWGM